METTKNHAVPNTLRKVALAFAMALSVVFTLLTSVTADAVEIDEGVTEVKIPIVLIAGNQALAGAELEFSASEGLEFIRYDPAEGIENPVVNATDGNQRVGFFSLDNKYVPVNQRLSFGDLVFSYAGAQPQSITVSEISLHAKTGTGAETVVDTRKTTNDVAIPVTRLAAASDNGENKLGSQAAAGSGNAGAAAQTGAGTAGAATRTGAGVAGQTEVVELATDDDTGAPAALRAPRPSSADAQIPDAETPLAAGESAASEASAGITQPQALLGVLLITVVIAAGTLYYVFFYRKKQRAGKAGSYGQVI
ncbi:MAG: hypothetical protein LBP28_08665 [Coriobacteriales bacterium]|jgi:hypothetical protein|nr:hypothetical protein [Coriobacteriales bacterium]